MWLLVQKLQSLARLATTLGGNHFLSLLSFFSSTPSHPILSCIILIDDNFRQVQHAILCDMYQFFDTVMLQHDFMIGLFPLISCSFGLQQIFEPFVHDL